MQKQIKKIVLALMDRYEDDEELLNDSYGQGYNNGYHDALVDVLNAFKITHDFQWRD